MKIKGNIFYRTFQDHDELVIPVPKGNQEKLLALCTVYDGLDLKKDYLINIFPKPDKKTRTQVKYFWELLDQLGRKLNTPNNIIYKELVRDNGVFQIAKVKKDAIKEWEKHWKDFGKDSRGEYSDGWFCENIGSADEEYDYIKCYEGISAYSRTELTRIITQLEYECKENGIYVED